MYTFLGKYPQENYNKFDLDELDHFIIERVASPNCTFKTRDNFHNNTEGIEMPLLMELQKFAGPIGG